MYTELEASTDHHDNNTKEQSQTHGTPKCGHTF